jgi:hypothetical protein
MEDDRRSDDLPQTSQSKENDGVSDLDSKERMWQEDENAQIDASAKNGVGCFIPFLVLVLFFGGILWIAYR